MSCRRSHCVRRCQLARLVTVVVRGVFCDACTSLDVFLLAVVVFARLIVLLVAAAVEKLVIALVDRKSVV